MTGLLLALSLSLASVPSSTPRFQPLAQQFNDRYRLTLYRIGSDCVVLAESMPPAEVRLALTEVECP